MFDEILSWPFAFVLPTLWAIGFARANGTYWVGRGANRGYREVRSERRENPTYQRAIVLLHRYGVVAVALCFVTIGLQTAVLLAAGATRMPLRRFIPATAVGATLWSVLYSTVGLAVVHAWLLAVAGSWWAAIGLVALVFLGGVALLLRRRRQRIDDAVAAETAKHIPAD
ncbi:DedA family protein [Blastococcus sp. Marseille-P5729]|uniref:DedA family protein n=1 Tax=Blastococcus sp. Marseille-P5729 TaxID=2086582 RepID=UPI000D0FA9EB|nr:VTT domain-containing protein [Blastococcus sp. Marseille-P5729]